MSLRTPQRMTGSDASEDDGEYGSHAFRCRVSYCGKEACDVDVHEAAEEVHEAAEEVREAVEAHEEVDEVQKVAEEVHEKEVRQMVDEEVHRMEEVAAVEAYDEVRHEEVRHEEVRHEEVRHEEVCHEVAFCKDLSAYEVISLHRLPKVPQNPANRTQSLRLFQHPMSKVC